MKPSSWAMHVTYENRLPTIAERGLLPIVTAGGPQMARMGIVDLERGEVYLTSRQGVAYWYAQAQREGEKIAPAGKYGYVPVVLRMPMPQDIEPDISGSDLASAPAWTTHNHFGPKEIWFWDGSIWRPVQSWDRLDARLALKTDANGVVKFRDMGYNPLANVR
jgi:hypothetical protein